MAPRQKALRTRVCPRAPLHERRGARAGTCDGVHGTALARPWRSASGRGYGNHRDRRHRHCRATWVPRDGRPRRRPRRAGRQVRRGPGREPHGGRRRARGSGRAGRQRGSPPVRHRRSGSVEHRAVRRRHRDRRRPLEAHRRLPARLARPPAALPRLRDQARLLRRHRRPLGAIDWIASGSARGRKALIVCTDIARYALNSPPGEPTQGAGAVALHRLREPAPAARSRSAVSGAYASDVNDFWRPLVLARRRSSTGTTRCSATSTRSPAPTSAWKTAHARRRTRRRCRSRGACYHVPYGKMAKKAHRQRMSLEGKTEAEADADATRSRSPLARAAVGRSATSTRARSTSRSPRCSNAEAEALEGQRVGPLQLRLGLHRRVLRRPRGRGRGRLRAPLEHRRAAHRAPPLHHRRVRGDPPRRRRRRPSARAHAQRPFAGGHDCFRGRR